MKVNSLMLTAFAAGVLGQTSSISTTSSGSGSNNVGSSNTTPLYPDLISLVSNTTALSNLWTFLQSYMEIANQYAHLTNVTVLGVSNQAFSTFQASTSSFNNPSDRSVLEAILEYHILQGIWTNATELGFAQTFLGPDDYTNITGGQNVGVVPHAGANLTFLSGFQREADILQGPILFHGGAVWIIDEVLTVPADISRSASWAGLTAASGLLNLTEITYSLKTTWDVTVFAPLDSGFANAGSVLSNMTTKDLKDVMKYHIVAGDVLYSSDFGTRQIRTSDGQNITMTRNYDGTTFVNGAKIVKSDIMLDNGVMHVIDNVLNPNNTTSTSPSMASGVVAFAGASNIGTTPFINIPLSQPSDLVNLNNSDSSAVPSSTPQSSSNPMSGGVIAAIVLGTIVGISVLLGMTCFCLKCRGYKLKVSRRSVLITHPLRPKSDRYELPPEGGRTEKYELPAATQEKMVADGSEFTTEGTRTDISRSDAGASEGTRSPPPPPPPAKEKDLTKNGKQKFTSPISPNDGTVWELSADNETRQRIEKFLRPSDFI